MPSEILHSKNRIDAVILPGVGRQEINTGCLDYHIVQAAPLDNPSAVYLRRQHVDGRTYLWSAPVEDWSAAVTDDDPRWLPET